MTKNSNSVQERTRVRLNVPGWWLQYRFSLQIARQFCEAHLAPLALILVDASSESPFYIYNARCYILRDTLKNVFDYHLISPVNQKLQYMYINSVLVAKVAWNLWTTNAHTYGWTKPYRMLKAPTQGEGLGKGTFRWFYPCLFCKEVDTSGDSH